GALSLLPSQTEPLLVMNGDLVTNIDFEDVVEYHQACHAAATMCVKKYDMSVPYGVVNCDAGKIIQIQEKPTQSYFINAGVYVLNPHAIKKIPQNTYYDMPSLFETLIQENQTVMAFPIHEYWVDVGHLKDYEWVQKNYEITV